MNTNDSFKIMKNTKKLVFDCIEFSNNFPKCEMTMKNELQKEMFCLIKYLNSYIVSSTNNRIKEKYLKDFIISLSMVDFYFECSYMMKIISFKKYHEFGNQIIIIRKMAFGLLKNEKE